MVIRSLVLVLTMLLFSGCVTGAQQEAQNYQTRYTLAKNSVDNLRYQMMSASPAFFRLRTEIGLVNKRPTFDQQMNDDKLSYEEAIVVVEGLNKTFNLRHQALEIETSIFPPAMRQQAMYSGQIFYAEVDQVYMQLVRRQITKGDAVRARQKSYSEYQNRFAELQSAYQDSLQRRHEEQVRRQQAAINAFQNAYYNERLLQQMNKPWYTNCTSSFNSVNCTTY